MLDKIIAVGWPLSGIGIGLLWVYSGALTIAPTDPNLGLVFLAAVLTILYVAGSLLDAHLNSRTKRKK